MAEYYCGRLKELSEVLGVSLATLHRGKNGEKISVETATRIAIYLEKVMSSWENKRRILKRTVDSLRRKL